MIKIIGGFVILIAIVTWVARHPVTVPVSGQQAAVVTVTDTSFNETGMVIFEGSGNAVGVPWIVYQTPNRPIATKQLVFDDVTKCDAATRELPCASNVAEGKYPVSSEQQVRIQGTVDGEKVYVTRVTYL
ncbi:hypothetical protein KKH15_02545 [Patescibacteria group bacterium]|nr:hypothetical protein [Patescibacteria group bacterium]MBU1754703.1 hypothetical protein [Patescibacteria group bacterium]